MKFNKTLLLAISFVLATNYLVAQQITIKGIIKSITYNQPIEYASISILNIVDSSVFTGVLSQMDGSFKIKVKKNSQFFLKVVAVGYESFLMKLDFTSNSQLIILDTIYLKSKTSLVGEVIVQSQKKQILTKLDKQVFKTDQFESAKGGTAVDLIKNLPSVSVTGLGEISLRGSTGFLLLINGKPITTDVQTVLSQLPANSIENIELITSPSAKYDADGKAGIINIITKKGTNDGLALQTNVQVGLPTTTSYNNLQNPLRGGFDALLSFKKKKWEINFGFNYQRNDINGRREGEVFTISFLNNTQTYFPSVGERSFDRYNVGLRSNINYTINNRNSFSVGFFASKKFQQRRADIAYNNSTTNLLTGQTIKRFSYFNSNLQNKEGDFVLSNFDYLHSFNNNSKIAFTTVIENAQLFGNTLNTNLNQITSQIYQQVTNPYSNPINGLRLKLDFSTVIGKGNFEAGYQFRWDKQSGNFGYTVTPQISLVDSLRFSGSANSTNFINGVYVQYSNLKSKLQYAFGLRYEDDDRKVNLSTVLEPYYLLLNNFFPSLYLEYAFTNSLRLKAGYNKRIQRNNNYELNPIPEREHSETLEQGDPNLLPQFIHAFELRLNKSGKKGNLFFTTYLQTINNPVQRVNSVYADTILNRVFTNASKASLVGSEFGFTYKPKNWLNIYIGGNIYKYTIEGALNILNTTTEVNNAGWVYSFNMNSNFNLGKNWNLQTSINYLSNRPTAQGEDSRFFTPNTTVKKVFGNGRYTMALQWQNMNLGFMNANQQRITTWGKNFYTTTNYIYETDIFLLNFSFNLNNLTSKIKLPASEISEKEF